MLARGRGDKREQEGREENEKKKREENEDASIPALGRLEVQGQPEAHSELPSASETLCKIKSHLAPEGTRRMANSAQI